MPRLPILNIDLANDALISRTRELLAEKEREKEKLTEKLTQRESTLNKQIDRCISELQQKDEEVSELNDLRKQEATNPK